MANVKIIAERLSSISYKRAKELNIALLAANIVMEEETIKDDDDEKGKKFVETIDDLKEIPSTATPSLGEVLEVFRNATKDTNDAIYVSASSKLSTLYEVGLKASKELEKEGKKIQVFDSYGTLSICGLYAVEASKLSREGKNADEIVAHLEELKKEARIKEYGVLGNLKYLEKSGRIGKAKFWLAQIFSFKPVISARDGVLEPVGKVRTNQQGLEMVISRIQDDIKRLDSNKVDVIFDYGDDDSYLREVVEPRLRKELKIETVTYAQISPLLACHLGPKVWGVAVRYL